MADEPKTPEIKIRTSQLGEQHRIKGQRYQRIYSNNMYMEFSNWDASLIFGEIVEGSSEVHTVEEIAHITMSHSFAKAVMKALATNLEAFEKQFGEIQATPLDLQL